jgi:branched-chain amino acid transport system substrate-binding protein
MALAAAVPVTLGDSDMRPHAMRLSRSKADAVLLFISPIAASRIIGIGKAMNYAPQWMSSSTCVDCPLMIEITQGLYEGVITANFGNRAGGEKVGDFQQINNPRHKLMAKYKKEVYENLPRATKDGDICLPAASGWLNPLWRQLKGWGGI